MVDKSKIDTTPPDGPNDGGFKRADVIAELEKLEGLISDLKIQFEQYFIGILPHPPDKTHAEVKRLRRRITSIPFKNSEAKYRLKTLEHRYHTYRSYWERVLRERDAGTYKRDLFRVRKKEELAEERLTPQSSAQKQLTELFVSYQRAHQSQTNRSAAVDFESFKGLLVNAAREIKEQQETRSVSFRIVVRQGEVCVEAHPANKDI